MSRIKYLLLLLINIYVFYEGYGRIHESLWHDEAWVAISILKPNIIAMLKNSDPVQVTPIGFLIIVRTLVNIFGDIDSIFRCFSIFIGVININLLFLVSNKILKNFFYSLIPLILFITNFTLLRYNAELKHYSLEIFCSLSTFLILDFLETNLKSKKIFIFLLSLAYSLLLFFSSSTILVLAFYLLSGLIQEKTLKNKINYIYFYIPFVVPILIIFVLYYVLHLSDINRNSNLLSFWDFGFPDKNQVKTWFPFIKERLNSFLEFLFFHSGRNFTYIISISFITFAFISKSRLGLFLIITPIIIFILSTIKLFPFAIDSRLFFFYHCLLFIPIGYFVKMIFVHWIPKLTLFLNERTRIIKFKKLFQYTLYLIFSIFYIKTYFTYLTGQIESKEHIYNYEPMKEYYDILSNNLKSEDVVYLYYNSKYAFNYYNRINKLNIFPTGWYEQYKNTDILIRNQTKLLSESSGKYFWLLVTRPFPNIELMKWEDEILEQNAGKFCHIVERNEIQKGKIKNGILVKYSCGDLK